MLSLTALTLGAGCSLSPGGQRVTMHDAFDLDLFGPHLDELHSPYVVGAQFNMGVETHDGTVPTGWTLRSSNPAVLAIGAQQSQTSASLEFAVAAAGAGQATLSVIDSGGKVVDSHVVTVGVPDSVQLYAHGLLLAGEPDDQARITVARVVSGGEATFLVRYFQGGTELSGSGALTPTATGATGATTLQSTLATSRDWLRVDGSTPGSGEIALVVGGQPLGSLPVTVVDASAIENVGLAKQDDSKASDGQSLYVFARAFDASGKDLYGASFQWSLDGAGVTSSLPGDPSDGISYQYKGSSSDALRTSLGPLGASAPVHAKAGSASVDSTASVGCSVGAPGAGLGSGAAAAMGLGSLAAALVRRRRARASW